jgi:hypothetical protein
MSANHGGSPTVLRVKRESRHPGEASCTSGQAREAVVGHDINEGEGGRWWLGMGFLRAPVGAINRGNRLRACGERS